MVHRMGEGIDGGAAAGAKRGGPRSLCQSRYRPCEGQASPRTPSRPTPSADAGTGRAPWLGDWRRVRRTRERRGLAGGVAPPPAGVAGRPAPVPRISRRPHMWCSWPNGVRACRVPGGHALEVDDAFHGHAGENGDATVTPETVSTAATIPVPAVLVEESRGRRMTPEWACGRRARPVSASATLSLRGEQELAQQFDRLAALLVAFITVMKADSGDD